jgi:hypothetical protein
MKFLKKQFLLIDIFGSKARFSINGHKTYQTVFGAFITIISYIVIFIFFFIFSKEMIYHRKPNIITSELIDSSPIHFIISDEFVWAFSLQHSNYSSFIDETVYNVDAFVAISNVFENGTVKETRIFLDTVKCSNYSFKSIPEYFYGLNINNLYCVNLTGITLRGVYMEDKWTTINFQFKKCVNSTSNNNKCRSADEITEILNGGYMGIFTTDYQILPNNYKQPAQIYGKNIFTTFSVKQYTDFWVYFQIKQINTDKGILFDSIVSESVLTYEYTYENKDYRESNIFLTVYLRESTNRKVLDRTYSKFQDIAANVGGIIKVIFIIGEIITYFFRRTLYKNYILQFFNLDESKFDEFSKEEEEENNEVIKLQTNDIFSSDNNYKRHQSNYYNKSNLQLLNLNKNGTLKLKTKEISPKRIKFSVSSNTNLKNVNFLNSKKGKETRVSGTSGLKLPLGFNTSPLRYNTAYFNKKKNTAKHVVCFMTIFIRKNSFKRIKEIHKQFNKILFIFDIIQYIKTRNEINLLEKTVFSEQERKNISNVYHFDYDLQSDKKGYDYLFLERNSLNQNTDSIFKINAT